ncbi:MAG TPA: DUF6249 domain-containing protein [Steroidobacter sp.]
MEDNLALLIPILGIVMPLSIPIVWIVLNYRKRRRLMELHHAERMAAIERGMDVPPLPIELISGSGPRRRSALLPGLIWFFIGLAVLVSTVQMDELPLFCGLIPLGVGLAYLIYYFVEGRKERSQETDQAVQPSASRS